MNCIEPVKKSCRTAKALCFAAALLLGALAAGPLLADTSTHTVSGSWTAPEGVTSVTAEVWGGGGGGGGGTGLTNGGSGGGGGGFARKFGIAVVPGSNYAVNVGNGGAGTASSPGTNGGQSYFISATTVAALGGTGGGVNGASAGIGGGGSGDVTFIGGGGVLGTVTYGGGAGSSAGTWVSGSPGTAMTGGSPPANGGPGGNGSSTTNGNPGMAPGGGGGGAWKTGALSGGSGAAGQVVVTYSLPKPGTPAISALFTDEIAVTWAATSALRGYLVEASTAANFSGTRVSTQTPSVLLSTLTLSGLSVNTTYFIRVGSLWQYATYYTAVPAVATRIEDPVNLYADEVSSWSITAAVYASTFSNFSAGLSGVNIATGMAYGLWNTFNSSWTPSGQLLVPGGGGLHQAAAVALGGKLYVLGGTKDGTNPLGDIYEYDPATNNWIIKGGLDFPRYALAAAAVGGKIYAIGGFDNTGFRVDTNEECDPGSGACGEVAPMPAQRDSLAAVALNGKVYAMGGEDGVGISDRNESYNPASNTWSIETNLLTPARRNLAAAVLNGKIHVLGGYNLGEVANHEVYDPETKNWDFARALPGPRHGLAAGAIGGKIYAVAGRDMGYPTRSDVYNPATDRWASATPAPFPREGMAYAALQGSLYLVGGNDGNALVSLSSTTRYNPGLAKTFKGLSPNREYFFRAKARNSAGLETGETVYMSTYTLATATMPLAGEPITEVGYSSLTARWSGFNDAGVRYKVQAATAANFTGDVMSFTSHDSTTLTFNSLKGSSTYYVRVLAYNNRGYTDNAWTFLGSTRTAVEPLPGSVISTITPYALDNPGWSRSAVRDSQGKLYIAYLKKYGGKNRVFISSSADNGRNWTSPPLPIDGLGGTHDQVSPALAIDSKDGLHLAWGQTGVPMGVFHSSASAPGYAWSAYATINPALNYAEGPFNIAVDSKDGLHLAWSSKNCGIGGCYRVRYSSRSAVGLWTPIVVVGTDGNGADHAALAVDASDGVHLVTRHAIFPATDLSESVAYSSRSASDTWGNWSEVYDGSGYDQGAPALTINSNGQLFAAWHSADGGHPDAQIKYSVKPPEGVWSGQAYAAEDAMAVQQYPAAAADALGNVYVLWSGSDSLKPAANLKGSVFDGAAWDTIDELTSETTGYQLYPQLRWAGWRNNGGGIDVIWNSYDGAASTMVLRAMQGPDVPMSPGWSLAAWPLPEGCGFAVNVRKDGTGDFRGIQQSLAAVPVELSTVACVVVRDAQTYSEQVTVQGFRMRWETPVARLVIMSDPALAPLAPVVIPPMGAQAAFRLHADSVTVQGFTIISTNSLSYGILASSNSAVISSVNVVGETIGGSINMAGILVSSRSLVAYSSVTVHWANGISLQGPYNEVIYSTAVSAFNTMNSLYISGSDNTVSRSYFHSPENSAVYLNFAHRNTITYSTMTGVLNNNAGLFLNASDFNTVRESYMYHRDGYGAALYNMSDYNTIENSTMASAGIGSSRGLYVYNSSSNSVTGSRVSNSQGLGASLEMNSGDNRITYSVIIGSGPYSALSLNNNSSRNSVSGSLMDCYGGNGVEVYSGSSYNTISYSTIASGGAGTFNAGLYVNNSATTTVISSYIQGSTGAYISNSGVAILRDSVFKATNTAGPGLYLTGALSGLFAASSTFSGGALAPALQLGNGNLGKVELSSTVITGGQYGMFVAAPGTPGSLRISSVTFSALSPGATALYFTSGFHDENNSSWEYLNFASTNIHVNVNGENLFPGSSVYMSHPEGKWGAVYEKDSANNYVNWPTTMALPLWPPNGATNVSMAPALRATAEWGSSVAQYAYKVGYDQSLAAPIWGMNGYDQTMAQSFLNNGAFSGQDATLAAAGDAFLYNSTSAFVFYSTATPLISNTTYYWTVRVRTPESGAYGQWSATQSFTTGELASGTPVNNLAVTQVALSSPSVDGVNIGFRVKENNLFQGFTAGGAIYNTADWVFVKFSTAAGVWNHATLTAGQVGAGATLATVSDKKGVFLNHTNTAAYWNATATVTWKYADDGVLGGTATVKVFAVSMVRVPMGGFQYNVANLGGTGVNNIAGPITVGAGDLPSGAEAGWPNGYNPFYLMRYEITQGQYADFLNTIPSAAAALLYSNNNDSGHYMTNSGMYEAADRFAAKNYLSTTDMWSFLSWAGLRPPTEMEFEKAARDLNADARTYPWGSDAPDADLYSPPNEGGMHYKHYMNFHNSPPTVKVLASGRYMSGDAVRTPAQTGASPYGIADLAGNVYEYVINCSHLVVPGEGNGTLAWPSTWPAANAATKGLRGGSIDDYLQYARVSDRTITSYSVDSRSNRFGGRGARTAP